MSVRCHLFASVVTHTQTHIYDACSHFDVRPNVSHDHGVKLLIKAQKLRLLITAHKMGIGGTSVKPIDTWGRDLGSSFTIPEFPPYLQFLNFHPNHNS